jgi:hypothetical protein
MMQMLHHSACNLQESMEFGEFKLAMSQASQWLQHKQNGAADVWDPKIKDFLVNAWDRVNEFALLPHKDLDELIKKARQKKKGQAF